MNAREADSAPGRRGGRAVAVERGILRAVLILFAVCWVFGVVGRGFRGWSTGEVVVVVASVALGVCILTYLAMLLLRRFALRARATLSLGARTAGVISADGDLAGFAGRFIAVGPEIEGLRLDTGAGLTALLPWSEVGVALTPTRRGAPLEVTTSTGRVSLLPDGAAALRARWIEICAIADAWNERKLRETAPKPAQP